MGSFRVLEHLGFQLPSMEKQGSKIDQHDKNMMHENTDVANSAADDYTEAGYHAESERGLLTPVCSENYTSVASLSQVQL